MSALVMPKRLGFDAAPPPLTGSVGVVVPALNAAETIGPCVRSLLAQRGVTVEVLVVDDASTDDTATLAQDAGATVVRRETNGGPGAARNQGAQHVAGEFIFFAEADGVYAPDHLLTCLRALSDSEVGASMALGVRAWTTRENAVVRLGNALWLATHSLVAARKRGTGAWCYRRAVFERLGGFDPFRRHGEDVELASRVAKLGMRTGVAGWSTMTHRNPDTVWRWLIKSVRQAESAARQSPHRRRRELAGTAKVALLLAALVALLFGIAGHVLFLPFTLAVLLGVTLAGAEQRLALRFLWRTRDWRTLAASPWLFWLRRFGLAWGATGGVVLRRRGSSDNLFGN